MNSTLESTTRPAAINIEWLYSLKGEDINHIGPAARTFALQNASFFADESLNNVRRHLYDLIDQEERAAHARGLFGSLTPAHERVERNADVIAAREAADAARTAMLAAQAEVGGIVFCIAVDRLAYAHERIDALARKAAKIGAETLTLTDTDETVLLNYCYAEDADRGYHGDFLHVFCILQGATPKIDGFEFLATVNTTEAGNIIKRIPAIRFQVSGSGKDMSDEQAAAKLEAINLDRFRSTGSICEHCGYERQRNDTFVVYNEKTGETKQVGRQCLRDFTGANNPERILKVLQMVWEEMRSIGEARGQAPTILTQDYLTHCALFVRLDGYVSASNYDSATKHVAMNNLFNMRDKKLDKKGQPLWITPEPVDASMAATVRNWALNEWQETSEFAHNVKVAVTPDALDTKAAGMAAAAFVAFQRHQGEVAKREAAAASEFVGEQGKRSRGITVTVTNVHWVANHFSFDGSSPLYTLKTEDGSTIRVKCSNVPAAKDTGAAPEVGSTYVVDFTVNKADAYYPGHVDHPQYGKQTNVNRIVFQKTIG